MQQVYLTPVFHTQRRAEEKIENARNLKRLGVPLTTIAEATGLALSEIERLG
jgi:hypothetical protein